MDKNLLYISPIENLPLQNTWGEKEDFFEIYWMKEGTDLSFKDFKPEKLLGEWMYLIPPFRKFNFAGKEKKGIFIAFHRGLLDLEIREYSLDIFRLFNSEGEVTILLIPEEETDTLNQLSSILSKEVQQQGGNFLFLKNLLKAFLIKLIFLKEKKYTIPDLNEKRVHDFLFLVEDHYLSHRKAGFYAEKLNITPKRLNQILKAKLNKTITQLLHERLIMEARHELYISEKSIMELGIFLGFSDKSYFSRFFKKMTGLTPESFKSQIRKRIES